MKTDHDKYYCIPDVHGCSNLLDKALAFIYSKNPDGGKIIFLGDYIDRGPNNLGVLNTVMNPPENWEFIPLVGNHEIMFLESYRNKEHFYDNTAALDLAGYRQDAVVPYEELHANIPKEIVNWMAHQTHLFWIEDKNVFAHADYADDTPPEYQQVSKCVWLRRGDFETYYNDKQGFYLTHGHTPRKHGPVKATNRTNLDAGAVFYDRLVIAEYKKGTQGPVDFHEFLKYDYLD